MSARLTYTVPQLRTMLEEQRDRKIAKAAETLAKQLDSDALEAKVAAWRVEQEQRVRDLAARLDDETDAVADTVLEAFAVADCPRQKTRYSSPEKDHDREVDEAVGSFTNRVRRLENIKDTTELSLTPTMLRDWFGL